MNDMNFEFWIFRGVPKPDVVIFHDLFDGKMIMMIFTSGLGDVSSGNLMG